MTDMTAEDLTRLADECRDMGDAAHQQPGASKYMRTLWKAEAAIRDVLDRREAEAISQAARDVLAERQRQVSVEGWDDIHDDCNDRAELAQAAACYALSGTPADEAVFIHGRWKDPRDLFWPWDRAWWKPTNRRRDLVKAGALILAEIERLDRATPTTEASHGA